MAQKFDAYRLTIECTTEGVLSLYMENGDKLTDIGVIDLVCSPSGFKLGTSRAPATQREVRELGVDEAVRRMAQGNKSVQSLIGQYL